jgi:serine O-acetyltransferase
MFIFDRLRTSAPPLAGWRLLLNHLAEDLRVARRKDPASSSLSGALLHQGVHAVWLHRVAYRMHRAGWPIPARLLSYATRLLTGVDVHPGAQVGPGVFIDHGVGVVIGETAVLEREVMLYHNVTVGSVGWWNPKVIAGRRHPVIGHHTVLCTGCLVLGPVSVGPNCVIGANSIVLADVPAGTRIPPGQTWPAQLERQPWFSVHARTEPVPSDHVRATPIRDLGAS